MLHKLAVMLAVSLLLVFGCGFSVNADADTPLFCGEIDVEAADGVIVTISNINAICGKNVRFSIKTEGEYVLRGIEIADEFGNQVQFKVTGDFKYSFLMPCGNVKITVRAEDYGLAMRSEFAIALWKLAGSPAEDNVLDDEIYNFEDLKNDSDYTEAVKWINAEGILSATDGKTLNPDENFTREELAYVIYRFAQKNGLGFSSKCIYLLEAVDREVISDFAYEPVCWTVMNGILNDENGVTGYFNPQEKITRHELKTALERLAAVIAQAENTSN